MGSFWAEITGEELRFYGEHLAWLVSGMEQALEYIEKWQSQRRKQSGQASLLYTTRRIKTAESMRQKLLHLGKLPTVDNALTAVHDAAGVRAVCLFVDDVYALQKALEQQIGVQVLQVKDYIAQPKPSGYRSVHVLVELSICRAKGVRPVVVEIQLRTVAMDTWAALEHEIHYKQEAAGQALMRAELKRCADEIASTELSMQTIRELLAEERSGEYADIAGRR